MSAAPNISVIILTYNEEVNIGACLSHLEWCDDIIIVDSGSTDGTIEAARDARPDVRVFEHAFQNFGEQRNWALDHTGARHEWVLFLDADEHCTAKLAQAIDDAVRDPSENVGYYLTCRNFFLGRWIKRCTFYPSWQLRLLKIGEVRFQKEGHGQREVTSGTLGHIAEPYDHYGFSKGVADWIDRHNRYSTNELELIARLREEPLNVADLVSRNAIVRRRCLKRLAARFGCRPVSRFVYTYMLRGGFLDGWAGLNFCLLRFAHEIHITVKLAESRFSRGCQKSRVNKKLTDYEMAS
jgi:glycosyltransferase involved in cell wall biosynthesis